jgi:hypothetical protein
LLSILNICFLSLVLHPRLYIKFSPIKVVIYVVVIVSRMVRFMSYTSYLFDFNLFVYITTYHTANLRNPVLSISFYSQSIYNGNQE